MTHITENEVRKDFEKSLSEGQFEAWFQPQLNISSRLTVGAEALCRWRHPEYGIITPKFFIGFLEEADLIWKLDLAMAEMICSFLKKEREAGVSTVPISFNLSRKDLYREGFIEQLEEIRKKYDIPASKLRVEVLESLALEGGEKARDILNRLHRLGYLVELDDFGSGYSSLNVLKDVPYDIIKLDMRFMSDDMEGRAGTIVSSVVRMAKWLKTPVLAEGVETEKQAEFLKSIGCDYAQGFLFSKAVPPEDFDRMLRTEGTEDVAPGLKLKNTINPSSFWNPESVETLVFNNFVGGAAVFRYATASETMEFLRVNRKYVGELHMNLSEEDVVYTNLWDSMDEEEKSKYKEALKNAISTGEEQEVETWRKVKSGCCGEEFLCIRSTVTLIGQSEDEYVFYALIRNITAEKKKLNEGASYEQKFKNLTEQANIYYWEYNVATKEMRPCFRCMRDLGLPAVVKNYPEPAIEAGIFPQDYADMYRDWHKQIAEGKEYLEAVIPLTVGRVPFRVRYTTEFDELGRPVKAYGSASYITPGEN